MTGDAGHGFSRSLRSLSVCCAPLAAQSSLRSPNTRAMSAFAILRLRKRQLRSAAAMARHALRAEQVTNADPGQAGDNQCLVGAATAEAVMEGIRKAVPEKRRKDAVEVIELLVSASPEAMKGKDRKAQDAYFWAALRWIAARFGGEQNVHLAMVHRDESTPHMQVLVTPIIDGKLQGNKLIGGPAGLRSMQTEFAEKVGRPHRLVRGIETKPGEGRASYQSIRRWYAAIAAVGGVNNIPPARKVLELPEVPRAPGALSSSATRQAYATAVEARKKAEKEREEVVAANRRRQQLIEQLAKVGVAVYGKQARSVGERLARADDADQRVQQAEKVIDAQRTKHAQREAELKALEQAIEARTQVLQLGQLETYAAALRDEVAQLEAARTALRDRPRPR